MTHFFICRYIYLTACLLVFLSLFYEQCVLVYTYMGSYRSLQTLSSFDAHMIQGPGHKFLTCSISVGALWEMFPEDLLKNSMDAYLNVFLPILSITLCRNLKFLTVDLDFFAQRNILEDIPSLVSRRSFKRNPSIMNAYIYIFLLLLTINLCSSLKFLIVALDFFAQRNILEDIPLEAINQYCTHDWRPGSQICGVLYF